MPRRKIENKFFEMTDGNPELIDEVLKRQDLMGIKEVENTIEKIKKQLEKIFKTKPIESYIKTTVDLEYSRKKMFLTFELPKVDFFKEYDFAKDEKDGYMMEVVYRGLVYFESRGEDGFKPSYGHKLALYPMKAYYNDFGAKEYERNSYIDISEKLYEMFQNDEEKLQKIQELDDEDKKVPISIEIPIDEKDNLLIDDIEIFMGNGLPKKIQNMLEDYKEYNELTDWIYSKGKDKIKNLIKGYKDRPEPNFRIKPGGVYANMKKEIDKEAAKANEINSEYSVQSASNTALYEYFLNSMDKNLDELESVKERIKTFEKELEEMLKDYNLTLKKGDSVANFILPDGSIKIEKNYLAYDEDKYPDAHMKYSLLVKLSDPKETGKPQEVQKIYEAAVIKLERSFEDYNDEPESAYTNNQVLCIPLKDTKENIFDLDNAFKTKINFFPRTYEEEEKNDIIAEFRKQIEEDLGLITEPENRQEKNQENQNNKIFSPNL